MSISVEEREAKTRTDPLPLVLVGLLVVLLAIFYAQVAHRTRPASNHFGDFRHFYYAARAMLDHTDLYTSGTGGYLYPPLIAFVYTPVAWLFPPSTGASFPPRGAALVMLAANTLSDIAGALIVARAFVERFGISTNLARVVAGAALLGVLLNVDKVHLELQMFQTNALMFFLFALSLSFLDRHPLLAGLPLGFILNIKYLSLAMLPWLILRRRWGTLTSFVFSAIGFALLPGVISGWRGNLHDLSIAYGGLLHMVGVGAGTDNAGAEQANVEDIRAWFSCSITSAMARLTLTHLGISLKTSLAIAGAIALATLGAVAVLYRRYQIPLWIWPAPAAQRGEPWAGVLGLEFSALVVATLCFSPQTNTRHLLLALLVTIPGAVLVLAGRRGVPRGLVLASTLR